MAKEGGFISEFKKFIMRGNVMDMAVGVIIGGAFTSVVTSLNTDIISPIIAVFGGTDFSYLSITLGEGANAPVITYGVFITAVINFLITALILFCILRGFNKASEKAASLIKKKEEETVPEPTEKECPYCYTKIHIKATRCPHCTSELK
jgi:large conductance mechanosensitive channel